MRIKFILQLLLALTVWNCSSQTAFNKGSANVSLGYGFPYFFEELFVNKRQSRGFTVAGSGDYTGFHYDSKSFGPILAKCEFGIKKRRGIALVIGYSALNIKETKTYEKIDQNISYDQFTDITQASVRIMSVGFRYNIHLFRMKVLDPYVGFGGGYMLILKETSFQSDNPKATSDWSVIESLTPPAYFSASIGLKYYFKPQWGAYVEFGFDHWATAQLGMVIKLD